MTQVQLFRLLYPVVRLVGVGMTRRHAYMVTNDASMWLHTLLWRIRNPRRWWTYRRRCRLLIRGRWEIAA